MAVHFKIYGIIQEQGIAWPHHHLSPIVQDNIQNGPTTMCVASGKQQYEG